MQIWKQQRNSPVTAPQMDWILISSIFPCRTNWKSKKKKKKKGKDGRLDLYALLGLQNERWTATDAQIKLGELCISS